MEELPSGIAAPEDGERNYFFDESAPSFSQFHEGVNARAVLAKTGILTRVGVID